ncbi:MAG: OadG family protein [Prolixibacteraceae bacterium]|nr:OadG family protein [Prolixibacteraceae bacterium]
MILLNIDNQTLVITVVGWLIVFVALIVLIIVFNWVPRLLHLKIKKRSSSTIANHNSQVKGPKYISGDETAAIALALYLYFEEQHDEESNVITIKQIQRRYSPWSSKIYGVRNFTNNLK